MTRIREEEVLCTVVMVHKGTSEQFLQVSQLYRALILLDLALYRPTCSVSLIFMVLYT